MGAVKTWKKRWFSLKKDRLFYYEDKKNDGSAKDQKGFISLVDVDSIESTKGGKKGAFQLNTLERVYYLQAPSEEVKAYWIENLTKVVESIKKSRAVDKNSAVYEDKQSGSLIRHSDIAVRLTFSFFVNDF